MLLYRARTTASRLARRSQYGDNSHASRIAGRWFTSDLAAAIRHRDSLIGETEIVEIELPDAVAHSFKVATTPQTLCGLNPGHYTNDPLSDHVIPRFHAMHAKPVVIAGVDRIRDVIDVGAVRTAEKPRIINLVLIGEDMRIAA